MRQLRFLFVKRKSIDIQIVIIKQRYCYNLYIKIKKERDLLFACNKRNVNYQ